MYPHGICVHVHVCVHVCVFVCVCVQADIIGSPYAITNYSLNAAEIGTNNDLAAVRAALHSLGLLVRGHCNAEHPCMVAVLCCWGRAPGGCTMHLLHA